MASVVLKPNADGSTGLQGEDRDNGGFVVLNARYTASTVNEWVFIANRAYVVQNIIGCPAVAGTDVGAVTAGVVKASGTTAITSGTALHSGTFNLKGTINTNQTLTPSTTSGVTKISAGDRVGISYTGVLTAAVGCITIVLAPA